ncbi:TPA: hypothetical protein ACH3X1_013411 [Trebouxia sp. C0004]
MTKFNHKQTTKGGKKGKGAAAAIDHNAHTATSAAAADGKNVDPRQATDQSTSMSTNANEKTSTSGS